MTGFHQQSLSEGTLNGSRVPSRIVAIHIVVVSQPITGAVNAKFVYFYGRENSSVVLENL